MELILNTEKIKKALNAAQTVCQKKTILDTTQNVLFEIENDSLVMRASDTEVYLEISIDTVRVKKTSSNDKTILNAKLMYDIIKEIEEEEVQLIFSEKKCRIKTTYTDVEINAIESSNFPEIQMRTENILRIKNKHIIEAIEYCAHLSTSTLQKIGIGSILYEIESEAFKTTATDGHCLAHIAFNENIDTAGKTFSFLLSKKASLDIKRVLESIEGSEGEIFIGKSNEEIVFSSAQLTITTKTIREKFPEYKKIINQAYKNKMKCNKNTFIKITKRLSLFTDNKFIPGKLIFDKEKKTLHFSIENNTIGKNNEEMQIEIEEYSGNDIEFSAYPPYLLKAGSEMGNEEEEFELKTNNKQHPIIFVSRGGRERREYVVMPMRSEK